MTNKPPEIPLIFDSLRDLLDIAQRALKGPWQCDLDSQTVGILVKDLRPDDESRVRPSNWEDLYRYQSHHHGTHLYGKPVPVWDIHPTYETLRYIAAASPEVIIDLIGQAKRVSALEWEKFNLKIDLALLDTHSKNLAQHACVNMTCWKPIDSAPLDGTLVDLWVDDYFGGRRYASCNWSKSAGRWAVPFGPDGMEAGFLDDFNPIFWRPVPPSPHDLIRD